MRFSLAHPRLSHRDRDLTATTSNGTGAVATNATASSLPAHALPVETVLRQFGVDQQAGLSSERVDSLRATHGANELTEVTATTAWWRFVSQFTSTVVVVLIGAALISVVLGEWADAIVIAAIVLLNALLGFIQEDRAERTLASLHKLSAPKAKVLRDRVLKLIHAREVVPGDIVHLEAGASVPADARLISRSALKVQEAALTGESVAVEKDHAVHLEHSAALADRVNMAYAGTHVVAGHGTAVVVATGMQTELGRIQRLLQRTIVEPTPLQRRLAQLGRMLAAICIAVVGVIFLIQLMRGGSVASAFLVAVSLAVAAIPEGMPAVVTLALALGVQRMARRNALVRKLPSVETLGSVTVICSDKTGTLTKNEMTVSELFVGGERIAVRENEFAAARTEALLKSLKVMAWCNTSRITYHKDGTWTVMGDPTETALVVASKNADIEVLGPEQRILLEVPFDSDRKMMSVVLRTGDDTAIVYTKGAPDVILNKCDTELINGEIRPLSTARREEILQLNSEMGSRALRVLGLASREATVATAIAEPEREPVFAGLVGMIDPPREEAKIAVQKCHQAGIRAVMITGDHPTTAIAIAKALGIAQSIDELLTGPALDQLSDAQLADRVDQINVYARVTSEHKLRVVRALKSRGHIVAMTGDGVNDAPAVRAADIGIAMGITGTDVTKQASAMVLLDDNFATIVNAVEEGRAIVDNIRKFMQYLLACNIGEVLFVFAAAILGWPIPLLAIQILWLNLVTDGLPALALGIEPPESDVLARKPAPHGEPLVRPRHLAWMVAHGATLAGFTMLSFLITWAGNNANLGTARTVAFCTLSFGQLSYALTCRSERFTMPQLGFFSNPALVAALVASAIMQLMVVSVPFLQHWLRTTPLQLHQWVLTLLLSLGPVTAVECVKLVWNCSRKRGPACSHCRTGRPP